MPAMTIGDVARQAGLRASAIRYYEKLGLIPTPQRLSGRRRYGTQALQWLAVVRYARSAGFTIAEIRQLVRGFADGTPASVRWRKLAGRKIAEMDALIQHAQGVKLMLQAGLRCRCLTLEECGQALSRQALSPLP